MLALFMTWGCKTDSGGEKDTALSGTSKIENSIKAGEFN